MQLIVDSTREPCTISANASREWVMSYSVQGLHVVNARGDIVQCEDTPEHASEVATQLNELVGTTYTDWLAPEHANPYRRIDGAIIVDSTDKTG